MAAAFPSQPDKARPLTPSECEALVEIAAALRASNPDLAEAMERNGWTQIRLFPPLSLRPGLVITVMPLIIFPAVFLMTASGWATAALLITLFALPLWLLQMISHHGRQ